MPAPKRPIKKTLQKQGVRPAVQPVDEPDEVDADETTHEPVQSFSGEMVAMGSMTIAPAKDGYAVMTKESREVPVELWFLIEGKVVPGIAAEATITPVTDYVHLRTPQGVVQMLPRSTN